MQINRVKYLSIAVLFVLLFPRHIHASELKVLATFLPIYIFTKNVVGDREGATVDCLIPANAGPHDYHMRPSDMKRVADADLVIMNGLGLEDFIGDVLHEQGKEKRVLESAVGLPVIEADEEGLDHQEDHRHHGPVNPHTWVSPRMAILQVQAIADFLSKADPDGEKVYRENARLYIGRLGAIQSRMEGLVQGLSNRKIITYHDAFDYLARDIGLEVAGVVYGPEGEDPSSSDLAVLIKMMRSGSIKTIFAEPQFSLRIAQIIAKEVGGTVHVLDPIATGSPDMDYYEKVQAHNLDTLRKALQ